MCSLARDVPMCDLLTMVEKRLFGEWAGGYLLIIAVYRRTLELHSASHRAMLNLGNVLISEGRHREAVDWLEQSLRIKPDYCTAHLNLGRAHAGLGDRQQAAQHYQQALRCNPRMNSARRLLAELGSSG